MSDEYLQRTVRKLLIDYGVKKLCGAILGNVREDFLCYSKLLEIKDVDVPVFLKKVEDVAEATPDVVPNVVSDVKPEPKPDVVTEIKSDVVADVKSNVDVSGNAPGNGILEVPKESTIGIDVSGGNVDMPNIKNVVVQSGKKPVKVKGKAAAPPVAEEVGDMSIDNIGNTNPIVQANGEEAEENVEDETSSQGSKKGDQYKQKQRAEQKLKREENLAKGIEPESLLTRENLEQWIGIEGRTYAYIAGKIVGCKEEDISTLAKVYEIKKAKKNVAQKVLIAKKTRGN